MPQAGPADLLGDRLGNYRLKRLLGSGSFAAVYLGEHIHLGTEAAVKVLLHARLDPKMQRWFKREARIIANLRHPNIVNLLEFDIKNGLPFLIMDLAPGGSLRHRHPEGSTLEPRLVSRYLTQAARALDYAHAQGVVHRDIKPENMLLGRRDDLLLSDFGVSVIHSLSDLASSSSGEAEEVAGTTPYMAPEQLQGRPCAGSDIYSLGIVLYEWLCGERPFRGSRIEIIAGHINAAPPWLRERNPRVSHQLEEVIMIALAKDPELRYPSASELAKDFKLALSPTSGHRSVPIVPTPVPAQPQIVASRGSRRTALTAVAGGLLVAAVGSGLAWYELMQYTPGKSSAQGMTPTAGATPSPSPKQGTLLRSQTLPNVVSSVAWLPNDKLIAVGCYDHTAQIWNVDSGELVHKFSGHLAEVASVAWSPNGRFIATASFDKTVRVWDATTGDLLFPLAQHTGSVYAVAWSPDGKYIASGSADATVKIWDAMNGHPIDTYTGHSDRVRAVAWSLNGDYIASGGHDGTVQVWKPTDKKLATSHRDPGIVFLSISWSPDGNRIASGTFQGNVDVWNSRNGKILFSYNRHSDSVFAVAWSPNGDYIASGSADKTVHVWKASDGSSPYNYHNHHDLVYSLSWSSDSKQIASGSGDRSFQVWQAV